MENKVRLLLWIVIIFGVATAYVDYNRMMNGKIPVFCQKSYDQITKTETFRGVFYIADRQVARDPDERLDISSDVYFRLLYKDYKIKTKPIREKQDYILFITPSINCPDLRLYHQSDTKIVYTDCIASVKVKQTKEKESKDLSEIMMEKPEFIDGILLKSSFTGIEKDKTTERYIIQDKTFSNKVMYLYKCYNGTNRNIYLTLDSTKRDYCK